MGYMLLGIENLAVALLFVALVISIVARIGNRWVRLILGVLAVTLPLLGYVVLAALDYQLEFAANSARMGWTLPLLALTLTFLVVAGLLVRSGLRGTGAENARPSYWLWAGLVVMAVVLYMLLWLLFASLDVGALRDHYEFGWFWPLLVLALGFLIGGVLVTRRGFARRTSEVGAAEGELPEEPAARRWPVGRLAIALAVAVILHVMTFSSLDATAKESLAMVRAEAHALAMSVAPDRVPDADNAATYYYQVIEAIGRERLAGDRPMNHWPKVWTEAQEGLFAEVNPKDFAPFDYSSPGLSAFFKEHAGEIELLRAAAAKPGCYFEHNYGGAAWSTLLPEITEMRSAAWLLLVHARWAAANGDLPGAFADLTAVRRMARHMATEPFSVVLLMSASLDRQAIALLQMMLGSHTPTADELQSLDFDAIFSYRRGELPRSLRYEEAMAQNVYADMDRHIDLVYAMGLAGDMNQAPLLVLFGLGPIYRVFLLVPDMKAHDDFMREMYRVAAMPYQEIGPAVEKQRHRLESTGAGPLARAAVPTMDLFDAVYRAEALDRIARVAVALHRFHAQRGRFPAQLAELAPDVIPIVPLDPYTEQPLHYDQSDAGWTLYSVGPNLADDGGKRIDEAMKGPGDLVFDYAATAKENSPSSPTPSP